MEYGVLRLSEFGAEPPASLPGRCISLAASTCRELSTLPFLAHFAARGGEVGEEGGILYVAVLATKLIHLPDEPAGVAQIGTQTVEVPSTES